MGSGLPSKCKISTVAEKYALSIDIGGTSTKVAMVSDLGEVTGLRSLPTDGRDGVQAFIDATFEVAGSVLAEAEAQGKPVAGIGISVAGFVDELHTAMIFNGNLPWLVGYPLTAAFRDRFSYHTALEIDSNAAALAEHRFGCGAGVHRFMVLSLGTGVGGGMVVGGELLRISYECLGDIGHVIVAPGGPSCTAGCKGCAEALISAPGVERLVHSWAASYPGSSLQPALRRAGLLFTRQIIASAEQGDALALAALRHAGQHLGTLLASITPALTPERIAIAGGLAEAGENLLSPAEETFRFLCGSAYQQHTSLVKARLGWQAALAGAACLLI